MTIVRYDEGLGLAEYLQKEQTLAASVDKPTLFTWIVSPTVIYGRHQLIEQEADLEYCRTHGIHVVQRKSGGGCVYADRGNLMVSYVVPSPHSAEVFDAFLMMLAGALREMGYEAVTTAHNDVLVGDRKVCGTACYTTANATIVHACMLYDVNLDALESALCPPAEKLQKHAVQSVRQRVRNLREVRDIGDIEAFRQQLENTMMINTIKK